MRFLGWSNGGVAARACLVLLVGLAPNAYAVDHGPKVAAPDWPTVVALVDRGTPGAGIFGTELKGVFCSGTLIAPTIVLTAAHCVADHGDHPGPRRDLPTQVTVYVGIGRPNHQGAVVGQHAVRRAVLHPDEQIDLALIELAAPVPGLIPSPLAATTPRAGVRIQSIGFGEQSPGSAVNTMGQKAHAERRIDQIDHGLACSARTGVRFPSSGGDSGGPAMLRAPMPATMPATPGSPAVVGVLTGEKERRIGRRRVAADCWIDVASHLPWIRTTARALEAPR